MCFGLVLALALVLAGCGNGEGRTALAIQRAHITEDGRLVVSTECATGLTATVGSDHGGSDLPEVTVRGYPQVGRCHPRVSAPLPTKMATRPDRIVDGTTSMVVAVD